jgi:hypothetical protein
MNWNHSKCPHCNQPNKDTWHILQCKDPRSHLEWARALNTLSVWMKSQNTNPCISSAILASLHQWNHNKQPTLRPNSPQIQAALLEQNQIGWFNFLLARHSRHWEHAQQAWILIQAQNERISSSRRWAASLTDKT